MLLPLLKHPQTMPNKTTIICTSFSSVKKKNSKNLTNLKAKNKNESDYYVAKRKICCEEEWRKAGAECKWHWKNCEKHFQWWWSCTVRCGIVSIPHSISRQLETKTKIKTNILYANFCVHCCSRSLTLLFTLFCSHRILFRVMQNLLPIFPFLFSPVLHFAWNFYYCFFFLFFLFIIVSFQLNRICERANGRKSFRFLTATLDHH